MMIHITRALGKLVTDPGSVFPHNHQMTERDLGLVKRQGSAGATERVYGLILERLKDKALAGELVFEFQTMDQIASMRSGGSEGTSGGGGWQVASKKKPSVKVNSVNTDYSSVTMNTTATSGGKGKFGDYRVCDGCKLYHQKNGRTCEFWDPVSRTFGVKAFLMHRSVRLIGPDGKSTVSKYWIDKLIRWTFPHIGVTQEADRQKILKDLRDAAAGLPKASPKAIEQYAKDSQSYVSLAMTEDRHHVNLSVLRRESDAMVNAVASRKAARTPKEAKKEKKQRKKARQKARKEAESSSEEDSDTEDEDSVSSGY